MFENVEIKRIVTMHRYTILLLALLYCPAKADFLCMCNYEIESSVLSQPIANSPALGFMYEFDCKPKATEIVSDGTFIPIFFEHHVGYLQVGGAIEEQMCQGEIPEEDIVTAVESVSPTVTSVLTTTASPTTTLTTVTTTASTTTTSPTTSQTTTTTTTTTPTTTSSTTTKTTTFTTTFKTTTIPTTPTTTATTSTTPTTTTSTPTTVTTTTTTPTTTTTTPTTITTTTTTPTTITTTPTTSRTTTTGPISWPYGKYGLVKTTEGCPGTSLQWLTGWRLQDTEDRMNHNNFSSDIGRYIEGTFGDDIRLEYCIKNATSWSVDDRKWPAGSYCILRHDKNCPEEFKEGVMFWDDEDTHNGNKYGGFLPDGVYDENTEIFFCCRNDGPADRSISLPTDSSFVLFKYEQQCQDVYGMVWKELFIYWDDDNTLDTSFSDGSHPLDDGLPNDHILYFCFYNSTIEM